MPVAAPSRPQRFQASEGLMRVESSGQAALCAGFRGCWACINPEWCPNSNHNPNPSFNPSPISDPSPNSNLSTLKSGRVQAAKKMREEQVEDLLKLAVVRPPHQGDLPRSPEVRAQGLKVLFYQGLNQILAVQASGSAAQACHCVAAAATAVMIT